MDTIMDMGNVIIGDIIPRVDNGINGIIPNHCQLHQRLEYSYCICLLISRIGSRIYFLC